MKHSVLCAGYAPLDIVRVGQKTIARRAGGTAGNVAAILAYLGWDAALAGQIGDDRAGDELTADLRAAGVDTSHLRSVKGALTARLVHDVRHDGHSFGYRCPECQSAFPRSRPLTLDQLDRCLVARPTPTVYFFDRANPATLALAERLAETETVIVFEPSVPAGADALARAAAVAHVIKHSDDRSVGGLDELHIKPRDGQVRITTHGPEGLEITVGTSRPRRLPAYATLSIDTGGAGDWTTAGFLTRAVRLGRLDTHALEEALRFGQALAAAACATPGARGLMTMTRPSVLRRARAVQTMGGLTSEPRLPRLTSLSPMPGTCESCLMPIADSVSRDAVSSAA